MKEGSGSGYQLQTKGRHVIGSPAINSGGPAGYCGMCGTKLNAGEKFCGNCGAPTIGVETRSRDTAPSPGIAPLVQKIADLLQKSGLAARELTSHNAAAVESAIDFVIGNFAPLRFLPGGRERVKGLLLLAIDKLPRKPEDLPALSSESEVIACLSQVRNRVQALYGDAAATSRSHLGYRSDADVESSRLVRELDAVESSSASPEQRIEATLLKARVYGCWQKPQGIKGNQQAAINCYEAALRMADGSPALEAEIRYHYALFSLQAPKEGGGGKEKAVDQLSKAVEIAPTSELRRKYSEELARHAKKRWALFG
jgi:hypothetical protein